MTLQFKEVTAEVGSARRAVEVLRDVTFSAPSGALTAVLGPSGSGKSSLLRVAAGLLGAVAGEVHIDGHDVTEVAPGRRGVGLCFQDHGLFPHLDVAGNLAFGLRARGAKAADVARQVRDVAESLDLSGLLDRLPRELSGGEAQRVALGRAVVSRPAVLLLDEPFGALDPPLRAAARYQVRETQRRLDTTTVLVSHDPAEAAAMADHLVVLLEGRVAQVGTPEEVARRPVSAAVARLVGNPPMNVIGEVGVRPESTSLVAIGTGRLDGRVHGVERWGSTTLVRLRTASDEEVAAFVAMAGVEAPSLGSTIGIGWRVEDEIHFARR